MFSVEFITLLAFAAIVSLVSLISAIITARKRIRSEPLVPRNSRFSNTNTNLNDSVSVSWPEQIHLEKQWTDRLTVLSRDLENQWVDRLTTLSQDLERQWTDRLTTFSQDLESQWGDKVTSFRRESESKRIDGVPMTLFNASSSTRSEQPQAEFFKRTDSLLTRYRTQEKGSNWPSIKSELNRSERDVQPFFHLGSEGFLSLDINSPSPIEEQINDMEIENRNILENR